MAGGVGPFPSKIRPWCRPLLARLHNNHPDTVHSVPHRVVHHVHVVSQRRFVRGTGAGSNHRLTKGGFSHSAQAVPTTTLFRREENCFAGGGDGTEAHLPNPPPPPPWSPCREGGLGSGCPTCRAGGGGGGPTPTYMAQNDPHVALIILTYVGENVFVRKNIPGQNLCSGAFGGDIRPCTKQRARHGSPFLEPPPPPLSFAGRPCHPPPAKQFSGRLILGTPLKATHLRKTAGFSHGARTAHGAPPN